MISRRNPEAALAVPVVDFLRSEGWDVYQEVQAERWTGVADIVAVKGDIVWIVEVKRSLSFELFAQAERWKTFAHFVSVAVPRRKRRGPAWKRQPPDRGREMALRILGMLGIGCLEVSDFDGVQVRLESGKNEFLGGYSRQLVAGLKPEHRASAPAGTSRGGHWTAFKATCRALAAVVRANPGISVPAAVRLLEGHHYASDASAIQNLRHWAAKGKVPGVTITRRGRKYLLWPAAGGPDLELFEGKGEGDDHAERNERE